MYFDGDSSRDEYGVEIVLISLEKKIITRYFKLDFETTNSVVEYEALLLGLELAKKMKVQSLSLFSDSEIVVKQVRNIFRKNHPRLRSYKNKTCDCIENYFQDFNIEAIPREDNMQANSLAISASTFKVPNSFQLQYQI